MTDDALPVFTPKYRAVQEDGGFRVTFFCDICDRGGTPPLRSSEQAPYRRPCAWGRGTPGCISTAADAATGGCAMNTSMKTR